MAGIISYTVLRPSDAEKLAVTETVWDAENEALNFATVDEESIVVIRTVNVPDRSKAYEPPIIIAVAHPNGALFRTVGTPGGRVTKGQAKRESLQS